MDLRSQNIFSGEERASWARRQEDLRRNRDEEAWEEEPDWDNPDVLAFYGGGQVGGAGPELLSPRLLAHLQEQARPASREFGVLIDCRAAKILQMVRGTQTSVFFNSSILNSVEDVAAIHTHNEDVAFSDADWDSFTASTTIVVEMVVSPRAIYILRKGASYDPFPPALGQERAGQYWKRRFAEAVAAVQGNSKALALHRSFPELQRAVVEGITAEMAGIFHVDFEQVEHQDA